MGKSKEQKAAQKAAKKAERQEKWNATKEKAKEKFSKLGSKVKKVFKPEDKSTAQKTNAEVFETAVSNLKKLRLELSIVRNSAGDMFIKDGSNAKTYVDQDAFDQYNSQIKALSKRIIEIKNQINASVEGLHEKESRSESLKTLNTLNTILTRIAEVWDRISEVDLPAGENYPESLINELRQLLSQLDLFVKNIKSISKKHAVFGGPALEQLPDLRAILNLFLSDFTGMIVQINNTMDNTSKPKSFKYSTKLDDGTKVGVKAISGNVGKVVTSKRALRGQSVAARLTAAANIESGEERAAELQNILRSAEHDLQLLFGDIRSNVSAVHRTGLGAADQMLTEYLEHQMELLRRLEALYHTNAYGPPSTFKDQLAAMISKAENMKKKVRNLLKKLSSKVQKTSQYSTIIEIIDTIDQSVDDMVNAIGLVLPELPVKEQPSGSDKDDVDDENNDDNHNDNDNDRPDDNDVNRPTDSKDGDNEHHPDTGRRTAHSGSGSDEDDRADYLFEVIADREPPPRNMTRYGAYKELKKLAKTSRHAEEILLKCPKMRLMDTSVKTASEKKFRRQVTFAQSPNIRTAKDSNVPGFFGSYNPVHIEHEYLRTPSEASKNKKQNEKSTIFDLDHPISQNDSESKRNLSNSNAQIIDDDEFARTRDEARRNKQRSEKSNIFNLDQPISQNDERSNRKLSDSNAQMIDDDEYGRTHNEASRNKQRNEKSNILDLDQPISQNDARSNINLSNSNDQLSAGDDFESAHAVARRKLRRGENSNMFGPAPVEDNTPRKTKIHQIRKRFNGAQGEVEDRVADYRRDRLRYGAETDALFDRLKKHYTVKDMNKLATLAKHSPYAAGKLADIKLLQQYSDPEKINALQQMLADSDNSNISDDQRERAMQDLISLETLKVPEAAAALKKVREIGLQKLKDSSPLKDRPSRLAKLLTEPTTQDNEQQHKSAITELQVLAASNNQNGLAEFNNYRLNLSLESVDADLDIWVQNRKKIAELCGEIDHWPITGNGATEAHALDELKTIADDTFKHDKYAQEMYQKAKGIFDTAFKKK